MILDGCLSCFNNDIERFVVTTNAPEDQIKTELGGYGKGVLKR